MTVLRYGAHPHTSQLAAIISNTPTKIKKAFLQHKEEQKPNMACY
jgi:hypothetical protein